MGERRYTATETAPVTHWIGGWVCPRAGLNAVGWLCHSMFKCLSVIGPSSSFSGEENHSSALAYITEPVLVDSVCLNSV